MLHFKWTKVRELTSTQLGHRAEPEFFTPKERRAAVQAAVLLWLERLQGQDVSVDLRVDELRAGTVVRVLLKSVAERSDEFHPRFVPHSKPDGHSSRLAGFTMNVHLGPLLHNFFLPIVSGGCF